MSNDDFNPNSIDAVISKINARLDGAAESEEKWRGSVMKQLEYQLSVLNRLEAESNRRVGASSVWGAVGGFIMAGLTILVESFKK